MTTEYLDASNSLYSNSFESIKRRRLISDDYKNSDIDCENLMDYSGDNFPSELSAKASSSSIQESITNMSNSHSTPEDTFSEIAVSSPSSKHCKPDNDSKDFDQSSDHYNLMNAPIHVNINQTVNEQLIKPSSSSSNNLKSIDDTIELVLSKIREENNFSKNFDVSQSLHQKCEKSNYTNDILNSASNNTISRASSFIVGSRSLENISYSKSGIPSCPSSSISNYTAAPLSTYSKSYSQQFYNYNNNYGVPPRMAANFSNAINASNYTDYGKIDYTRSNNYTVKEIDKSSSSKYNYYPYQLGNQAPSPFRQYLPANSYLNQSFYNPDNQSQTVTTSVIPIHNNPNYQMFQKSIKRNSYFDQIYIDDEVNHIYKDTSKSNQSYNIYFKTPQSNVSGNGSSTIGGTSIGLLEQTSSIRKKRINTSDINKLTPTKKRKITNQFSSMTTNSYDELLRRLKVSNYNTLLMNPTICQSNIVLSPKGFVENSAKMITLNKSLQYKKYRSSLFKMNKPKSFEDVDQEDKYLSLYINNNMSTEKTVDQKKHTELDELFEIVCSSPDTSSDPSATASHLHHLTVDDNNCDPKSPELFSSFNKQKRKYQNAKKENVDLESSQLNYNANYFITPIVSYSENETKLITELHPMKSQELIRNYTQLSGSFLKRTKINGKSFSNIHIEEAVSIASLSASKNQNSCFYCYAFLNGLSCIRKNGKFIGLESNDDFLFCSTSCYSNFKSYSLTDNNLEKQLLNNNINLTNNLKSTKVLIKSTPYKPPKNYKKVCDFEQYVRRRFPSEGQGDNTSQKSAIPLSTDTKKKRLLGVNYYYFKNEPMKTIYKEIEKSDQNLLLKKYSCSYRLEGLIDQRLCILCRNIGDGDEDVCGRLINIDADNWVHLNCALWCFEVFETVSGSLMEVQSSLQKAIKTICSFCNKPGAGIQCYRSKCTCVYHVPCAYKVGCIFYTDRGMYCPNHVVLNHPMHLPLLRVERRVNILRDESALIAGIVAEDQDVKIKFRTGSLTLNNIGQLLPEQLISGNYNSNSIIYPVGYHATRIYWSSTQINKRCKYECIIDEEQDMPLFKVKFIDSNGCEKISTDRSCDRLWKSILNKIAKLRQDSGLTRLFPLYMSGEQLYGLTEPQIIRVIESLPGVEMVKNYAFKFGKMQLITEMPLAINPSGCARSEPKLRTYVRRFRDYQDIKFNKCGILKAKSSLQAVTMYESGLNKTALLNSKTLQYKRLKYEWMNNVILSRSKIQGLGLFAAKDFEKSTMIIEYIGEIIRNEVGNAREKHYQARNNSIYMFRLNEDLIIDATVNGGLARYINHSCNPNCVAETLSLDCGSRIIITTRQMIERGEELTYDYKFDFEDNKADRIPCLCGSINCRKWMN